MLIFRLNDSTTQLFDDLCTELGMSLRELARQLEMSPPGVGFSVERGETIARENGLQLIE